MGYDYQPIDSLVDDIKGTVGYLTTILSTRQNFVFAFIIIGTILAINFLLN
jgi:hypothetical protein